jgi:DNA-binding transcriptional MerR regulator
MAAESPTDPGQPTEFTVDELARRARMTVRNVRAYASRGLLPPPKLRGRTGYYSAKHLNRLRAIRDLIDRGFTLAALERAPAGADAGTLAVARAMYEPYVADESEVTTITELATRAGLSEPDLGVLDGPHELGVLERLDDQRVRVRNRESRSACGSSRSAFRLPPWCGHGNRCTRTSARWPGSTWDWSGTACGGEFAEAGFPPEGWERITHAIETLQPFAAQALLATFRTAMAEALDEAIGDESAAARRP